MSDQNDKLKQLKTSSMDRRLSIAKASFLQAPVGQLQVQVACFQAKLKKKKNVKKP